MKITSGNKNDMEEKRLVSFERGTKIANENKLKFFETSAKENVNIELAVKTVGNYFNIKITKS